MCNLLFTKVETKHKNIIYICQNQNMSAFLNENILACKFPPTVFFAFVWHENEYRILILTTKSASYERIGMSGMSSKSKHSYSGREYYSSTDTKLNVWFSLATGMILLHN